MSHRSGLHTIDRTGRTEDHQGHQRLSVKGKKGGEILFPAFLQQRLQTGFFLHKGLPRFSLFTGRGFTDQTVVMHLQTHNEGITGRVAIIENAGTQTPEGD